MKVNINDINSFSYERAMYKISAYGKEYELPVRTTEFCDKQDNIDRELSDLSVKKTSSDIVKILKEGIDIFLGAGESNKLYPDENAVDIDELTAFYNFLKVASTANLKAHIEKYKSNYNVRHR